MATKNLSVNELTEVIRYDPDAGKFFWIRASGPRAAGSEAGHNDDQGYRVVQIRNARYGLHRVAWALTHGVWPPHSVDHINGDKLDNRIANLRLATHQQNVHNQRHAQSDNKSTGVLGVSRTKSGKYAARLCLNSRSNWLGEFETIEEASRVYIEAKRALHPFSML
jgi:hypothetical protein